MERATSQNPDGKRKHGHRKIENSEYFQDIKKVKTEDILGLGIDADRTSTRLLLTRIEFSKIVGKGGASIQYVRQQSGATIKGAEIDENSRLIVVSGTYQQVIDAFEFISEGLYESYLQTSSVGVLVPFTVNFMIETPKVGHVIGPAGQAINSMKQKSGAGFIQFQKDTKELSGVVLRVLAVDGSLPSIRSAHYHLLELFAEPDVMPPLHKQPPLPSHQQPQHLAYPQPPAGVPHPTPPASNLGHRSNQFHQPTRESSTAHPAPSSNKHGIADSTIVYTKPQAELPAPLPFSSLVELGLLPETVKQLEDMKVYLSHEFGLNLTISKEAQAVSSAFAPAVNAPTFSASAQQIQQPKHESGSLAAQIPTPTAVKPIPEGPPPRPVSTPTPLAQQQQPLVATYSPRIPTPVLIQPPPTGPPPFPTATQLGQHSYQQQQMQQQFPPLPMAPPPSPTGTITTVSQNELIVTIPKAYAGTIIGKNGVSLKELKKSFKVLIFVSTTEEVIGQRKVTIKLESTSHVTEADRERLRQCADHIVNITRNVNARK